MINIQEVFASINFFLQVDNKGRNFLHTAIQKSDIESVLFLIGVHANVNSRTQDSHHLTPLHLAVMSGSEIVVRNLVSYLFRVW
jgi:ankyrin repeat protein